MAYPSVSGTPPTQWAWEFLRRRNDYRQRWQHLNSEQGRRTILDSHGTVRSLSKSEADAVLGAGLDVGISLKWDITSGNLAR
jgi:hypothetical protein